MKGTNWTCLLYHIEGLVSLWMYCFLEVDEPTITYHQKPMEVSTWIEFQRQNRVLKDYFVIIGGEQEKNLLRLLGAEPQNIFLIVTKEGPAFETNTLPRDYIPVVPYTENENKCHTVRELFYNLETCQVGGDYQQANFVHRENLFGRCPSHGKCLYAYRYPSSPGT